MHQKIRSSLILDPSIKYLIPFCAYVAGNGLFVLLLNFILLVSESNANFIILDRYVG